MGESSNLSPLQQDFLRVWFEANREFLLTGGEDLAPQLFVEKTTGPGGVILDSLEEIAVNKVCAIVSRSEPRDFFDLHYLSTRGVDAEAALALAQKKDGGVNAESLAMILQSIPWEQFRIPGLETNETARFFQDWLERLTLRLYPD